LATGDYLLLADNDVEFSQNWERMTEGKGIIFPLSKCGQQESFSSQLAGYFWMMKRSTFNKLGLVSEEYGLGYYEDTDYFMRAQQKDIPFTFCNEVQIYHHGQSTSKKMDIIEGIKEQNKRFYETKFNGKYPTI
jgi:O-antigen biosynthesis protein